MAVVWKSGVSRMQPALFSHW